LPSLNGSAAEFNAEDFRLNQAFAEYAGGEKVVTLIPVRKPSKECWFRTHPRPEYWLSTPIIELKEKGGETYLVLKALWNELAAEPTFVSKLLVPTITRQNDLFLWPIKLPGPDGNLDAWNESAMRAADLAKTKWVRLCSNKKFGLYNTFGAKAVIEEPVWPSMSLNEMVKIAFKGRVIESLDHPVIQQLRGEI
jgi:hypothetical protein